MIRPFVSWRPLERLTLGLGYDHLHAYHSRSENRQVFFVEVSLDTGNLPPAPWSVR